MILICWMINDYSVSFNCISVLDEWRYYRIVILLCCWKFRNDAISYNVIGVLWMILMQYLLMIIVNCWFFDSNT
jgi:hypothetical protein